MKLYRLIIILLLTGLAYQLGRVHQENKNERDEFVLDSLNSLAPTVHPTLPPIVDARRKV